MSGLPAIVSLLFLWLMSGLHHIADVLVTLNKLTVRHWKLLLWLLVCFLEGGIQVVLWGVALVAFGGMRDTALRSPVEDLQKFSLCYGVSPPCSQYCRPSFHGTLHEHIYRIEHVHCGAELPPLQTSGRILPWPKMHSPQSTPPS